MDVLRTCYKQWLWFDEAQTVGNWVRWYFVDDAPFLPIPHIYTSETWDEVHWSNVGPGFAWNVNRIYDKGAPPSPLPPAIHYCGQDDWWVNGAPSDAPALPVVDGIPKCCAAGLVGAYNSAYSFAWDSPHAE